MICVKQLALHLGAFRLTADFVIPKGRIVVLTGPSGAGKSSLLNAIAGYHPITTGQIDIDGVDVTTRDPDKRGIAMLFQDGNLFPHLSVLQNVGLGLRPSLSMKPPEISIIQDRLTRVGLVGEQHKKPGALSGGQQSRAALARLLLQSAPVWLLDEPFAALGPALRTEMMQLTVEVAKETDTTLMMITHAPKEAEPLADDLLFVENGHAFEPKPIGQLLSNAPDGLRKYLGEDH